MTTGLIRHQPTQTGPATTGRIRHQAAQTGPAITCRSETTAGSTTTGRIRHEAARSELAVARAAEATGSAWREATSRSAVTDKTLRGIAQANPAAGSPIAGPTVTRDPIAEPAALSPVPHAAAQTGTGADTPTTRDPAPGAAAVVPVRAAPSGGRFAGSAHLRVDP